MKDTKETILKTALGLFATNGYNAVSVSMIADELGVTKGALYRHYENKRDIFDSILARMEKLDAERAEKFELPGQTFSESREEYLHVSLEKLLSFSKAQFIYWTEDPFASLFRRMLTLEQYRSPEMTELYQQYLASGPMEYVKDILAALNIINPQQKAAELYAPMFLMYCVYDGAKDKDFIVTTLNSCLEGLYSRLAEEAYATDTAGFQA